MPATTYPSLKVQALIDGHTSVDGTWTEHDFLALALAALDQAGASVSLQRRVNELVSDELADLDASDDESPTDPQDGPRCECGLLTSECAVAGPANHQSRLAPDINF